MSSREALRIGGQSRLPLSSGRIEVHEAATGDVLATVPSGGAADVDAAVSMSLRLPNVGSGTTSVRSRTVTPGRSA